MSAPLPADAIQAKQAEYDTLLAEKAALEETSKAPSSKASSFKDAEEEPSAAVAGLSLNEAHKDTAESTDEIRAPAVPSLVPEEPQGPVTKPFPAPLADVKPQPHADLTEEQTKKYDELLATVKSWTEVPTKAARNSPTEPLNDEDRIFITRECLLRYLRATTWTPTAAATRLLATLTWQREYGMRSWTPEYISPENETGKQVILGYDNNARPCLYLNPSKQNTAKSERQLHHLVFMLERVIDLMVPGQESTALLINFKDKGADKPSVGQGRETLSILQGHYPERLGRALISERLFLSSHLNKTSLTCSNSAVVHFDIFPPDISLHRPKHKS
jgi:hypothetical protein